MSSLVEKLRHENCTAEEQADAADEIERLQSKLTQAQQAEQGAVLEIERLTACIEHHQAVEADQERAIERLQSELDRYKSGYQGSCYACEPVGEANKHLRTALERARDYFNENGFCPDYIEEALRILRKKP